MVHHETLQVVTVLGLMPDAFDGIFQILLAYGVAPRSIGASGLSIMHHLLLWVEFPMWTTHNLIYHCRLHIKEHSAGSEATSLIFVKENTRFVWLYTRDSFFRHRAITWDTTLLCEKFVTRVANLHTCLTYTKRNHLWHFIFIIFPQLESIKESL